MLIEDMLTKPHVLERTGSKSSSAKHQLHLYGPWPPNGQTDPGPINTANWPTAFTSIQSESKLLLSAWVFAPRLRAPKPPRPLQNTTGSPGLSARQADLLQGALRGTSGCKTEGGDAVGSSSNHAKRNSMIAMYSGVRIPLWICYMHRPCPSNPVVPSQKVSPKVLGPSKPT